MYVREIFEDIIIRSGQFILATDDIELNEGKFLRLIKSALGKYNKYRPISKTFNLKMQSRRSYAFEDTFIPSSEEIEWGQPLAISSVTPTNITGQPAYSMTGQGAFGYNGLGMRTSQYNGRHLADPQFALPGQNQVQGDQMEKYNFPWTTRREKGKLVLYVPFSCDVEVIAIYNHKIFVDEASMDEATKYNIPSIDHNEDLFLDLIQGMFLLGLGNSRRAFTLNDIPIISDAAELVSEGKDLVDKALEDLAEKQHKFYLAYGD